MNVLITYYDGNDYNAQVVRNASSIFGVSSWDAEWQIQFVTEIPENIIGVWVENDPSGYLSIQLCTKPLEYNTGEMGVYNKALEWGDLFHHD